MSQTTEPDDSLTVLRPGEWIGRLAAEHDGVERLGRSHAALTLRRGRDLLVTFETVESVQRLPGARPRGLDFAERLDWSLLALFAEGESWFRDAAVYGLFDRLTDEGFFDEFDRILFFGSHVGGYAAAAFSVAAPGARVLAFRPVATLDPSVAGWDRRYTDLRRLDFSSRYGFAPDMVEAADRAFVVHDPSFPPDAMHAALFRRPNVTALRVPFAGVRLDQAFDQMEITRPLIEAAMAGRLDPARFARLWRARRDHPGYLRTLLKRLDQDDREGLIARLCRHGLGTRDGALFARRLEELTGVPLPAEAAG